MSETAQMEQVRAPLWSWSRFLDRHGPGGLHRSVELSLSTRPSLNSAVASRIYVPPAAVAGMPPIDATEKKPVRVCSDPSLGARSWIVVWVEADNTRDCGAGSAAAWNGASVQVHLVETIVAAPISGVKSNAKLSISPSSIGSNDVANRIGEFLIGR